MGMYTLIDSAEEEAYTRSENVDVSSGKISASVTLRVPAADRINVVNDVLGFRYMWPHANVVDLVATTAGIRPAPNTRASVTNKALIYDEYLITIGYSTSDANNGQTQDGSGNVYSEEIRPHAEAITLDHKDFTWSDGSHVKEKEAPVRIMRSMSLVRTIYNLFPPLPNILLDGPGCVNSSGYLSPTLGLFFAAETLLFGDPALSRQFTTAGFTGITLQIAFDYKKDGWNKFWRANVSPARFDTMKMLDGSEYKNHPLADFGAFLF